MEFHLSKSFFAEAAHRNPSGNERQQRLHGHSYRIELLATGPAEPHAGWVVDFGELKAIVQPALERIDHGYLNELPGIGSNTSIAALEQWVFAQAQSRSGGLPGWFRGVRVTIRGDLAFRPVRLPASEREELPARIGFGFEAAQSLPRLPEGHPCRNLHGHSYRMEIASADLDCLGPHLLVLYETLDHRYLNDMAGLDHATCERICRWTWEWFEARGVALQAVVAQETPSARCAYFGD